MSNPLILCAGARKQLLFELPMTVSSPQVEANPFEIELADLDDDNNDYHNDNRGSTASGDGDEDGPDLANNSAKSLPLRLIVCLSAVGLYWLTSFACCKALVNVLVVYPNSTEIDHVWKTATDMGFAQRTMYRLEVQVQLKECADKFSSNFTKQAEITQSKIAYNIDLINGNTNYSQDCYDKLAAKLSALQTWKRIKGSKGEQFTYRSNLTCPDQSRTKLDAIFDNPELSANQATLSVNEHATENNNKFYLAAESLRKRQEYDRAYFASKTQALTDFQNKIKNPFGNVSTGFDNPFTGVNVSEYMNCITLRECNISGFPDINGKLDDAKYQAELAFNETKAKAEAMQALSASLIAKLKVDLANMESTFQDFKTIFNNMPDIKFPAGTLPDVGKFPVPGFDDLKLRTFDNFPDLGLGDLNFPVDMTAVQAKADAAAADIKAKINAAGSDIKNSWNNWNFSLASQVDQVFVKLGIPKYDAPDVNIPTDEMEDLSAEFQNKSVGLLKDLVNDKTGALQQAIKENFKWNETLSKLSLSSVSFKFNSDSEVPKFDFVWSFLSNAGWVVSILDFMWRAYSSIKIFVKYWSGSDIMLPYIDIRVFKTTKHTPITVRYGRLMTNPLVIFGAAFFSIFVASVLVGNIYMPMFDDYQKGCGGYQPTGTLLTDNAGAAAYNFAAFEGNRDQTAGVQSYDMERIDKCGEAVEVTQPGWVERQDEYSVISAQVVDYNRLEQLIENCVDPSTYIMAGLVYTPMVGVISFPVDSVVLEVKLPVLVAEMLCTPQSFTARGILIDPVLNCTSLPNCQPKCKYPDKNLLQEMAVKTGCTTEWYLHGTIFSVVSLIVVFLSWNISRLLLFMGITRLTWKALAPKGFTFLASCSLEGEIEDDIEPKLADEIKVAITKYERYGKFFIIVAMVINIPYVIFALYLNSALQVTASWNTDV